MSNKLQINWQGKGYYKRNDSKRYGNEVRPCGHYESGAVRCTSLREVKHLLGNRGEYFDVLDYTAL